MNSINPITQTQYRCKWKNNTNEGVLKNEIHP